MFTDARSRRVVLVAHCLLNRNALSDGTADDPGTCRPALDVLLAADVGIIQLPCPELACLGLDRGDPAGADRPLLRENTRIRRELDRPDNSGRLADLADDVRSQVREYERHGFEIVGLVGVDRSPSCGAGSTTRDGRETPGPGVFTAALRQAMPRTLRDERCLGLHPAADDAPGLARFLERPADRHASCPSDGEPATHGGP
ncbi:MAG: DUF523 domain-containing protein [bacterium]|nr:DUF523 domain-containing protein [bacterium]